MKQYWEKRVKFFSFFFLYTDPLIINMLRSHILIRSVLQSLLILCTLWTHSTVHCSFIYELDIKKKEKFIFNFSLILFSSLIRTFITNRSITECIGVMYFSVCNFLFYKTQLFYFCFVYKKKNLKTFWCWFFFYNRFPSWKKSLWKNSQIVWI